MTKTADSLKIKIEKREPMSKGGIKNLRKEGLLPASLSQKGIEPLSFTIRRDELMKSISQNGRLAVFRLTLGRKTYPAMIREVQYAPVSRECLHVTFQGVSLTEETKADVAINALGRDSITHRRLEFLQHLDMLPVVGLPQDIPNQIEVDVSAMEAGDNITIADLKLPEGITTDLEGERVVFTVSHPRIVEEETAEDEAAAEEGVAAEAEAAAEAGEPEA